MTGAQWLYLLGSVIAVVGAYFTAKLGAKANAAKVVADKEVGAGQLALSIAVEQRIELRELRRWKDHVQSRWWPAHEDWDDMALRRLAALSPADAAAQDHMGDPPRLPLPMDQDEMRERDK